MGILQAFTRRPQAQLKAVIWAVNNRFVPLETLEHRRRIPILGALIPEWKSRRIIRVGGHLHVILFANGNYFVKEIGDPLPIIFGADFTCLSYRQVLPVVLQLKSFVGCSAPAGSPGVPA